MTTRPFNGFFEVRLLVSTLTDMEAPALELWSWLRASGDGPRFTTVHMAGHGLHPDQPHFRVSDHSVDYRSVLSLAEKAASLELHRRTPDVIGDGDPLARWRMNVELEVQLDDESSRHEWLGGRFSGSDGSALDEFLAQLLSIVDVQDEQLRSLLLSGDLQDDPGSAAGEPSAG